MAGPDRVAKGLDRAPILSALWIMVLVNMLFRDIHEIATREFLEVALLTDVPDLLLLVAGIVLSLAIAMIPLNRVLPRAWSRPANLVVAAIMVVGMATNPPGDLDDVWFAAVEILGLVAIAWLAWRWPRAAGLPDAPSGDGRLRSQGASR
jgi:hypothetical protein